MDALKGNEAEDVLGKAWVAEVGLPFHRLDREGIKGREATEGGKVMENWPSEVAGFISLG